MPGIISLVFIPLLCLYYFYKVDAFKVYNYLEFFVPNKDDLVQFKVEDSRKYKIFKFEDNKLKKKLAALHAKSVTKVKARVRIFPIKK